MRKDDASAEGSNARKLDLQLVWSYVAKLNLLQNGSALSVIPLNYINEQTIIDFANQDVLSSISSSTIYIRMVYIQSLGCILMYVLQETSLFIVADPLENTLCKQDLIPKSDRSKLNATPPSVEDLSFIIGILLVAHFVQFMVYYSGYQRYWTTQVFCI